MVSVTVLWSILVMGSSPVLTEMIYPDGGRNVIPFIRNKAVKSTPYNDGSVMAHIIGSGGMNFLYYFYILGVACENADKKLYKIIQADFEFCSNKTGPIPRDIRGQHLGSIEKVCLDWKIHKPCYKNLADDYDECLVTKPGLIKKGTEALRFTHAYAKFICGNVEDTEAHLSERYTKHLAVSGVFQCFPLLQDRIVNCIKKDKVSKTLCSKFFIVHACYGKYFNDENCKDVQPIYYMDDAFRNMSASLGCQGRDEYYYPKPTHLPHHGWNSEERTGWSSREHSNKENPWPGEQGRAWSLEREREPFIREREWQNDGRGRGPLTQHNRGNGRVIVDTHANRPYPDTQWNRPWIDILDAGNAASWKRRNEVDTRKGRVLSPTSARTPVHEYASNKREKGSVGGRFNQNQQFYYSSSTPRHIPAVALPPEGFARTRTWTDFREEEENEKFYNQSPSQISVTARSRA